jgi:hypothetical protein
MEYIVLLKDGSEVVIAARSGTEAEQIALENQLQPVGTLSKKMVSRADVNEFVKAKIERFLQVGSPTTEAVKDEVIADIDYVNCDVKEIVKQNKLLLNRVNVLQHRLDTMK